MLKHSAESADVMIITGTHARTRVTELPVSIEYSNCKNSIRTALLAAQSEVSARGVPACVENWKCTFYI